MSVIGIASKIVVNRQANGYIFTQDKRLQSGEYGSFCGVKIPQYEDKHKQLEPSLHMT